MAEKFFLSQRFFKEVLNVINDAIIIINREGRILLFNHVAQKMFHYTEEDVRDKTFEILFLKDDLTYFLPNIMKISIETGGFEGEMLLCRKDGERFFAYLSTSYYLEKDGQKHIIVVTVHDITRLKRLEHDYFEAENIAGLGRMAEGIAHEIRNPIVSIGGFTKRLCQRLGDESPHKGYIDIIKKEIKKLERIVSRVESYANMRQPVVKQENLIEIVNRAIQAVQDEADDKGLTIEFSKRLEDDGAHLYIDGELTALALRSIMINAVEASPEKGTIDVEIYPQGRYFAVDIEDKGCGISEENISAIFEPFFTTKTEKIGFDLTEAHKIIEAEGGNIEVQSELGKGTIFHILLPMDRRRKIRTQAL